MINAVILISGGGSNLQAMVDAVGRTELPINIKCVISNNADAYGLERAKNAGLATAYIDHRDFESRLEFDTAVMARIDQDNADIVILAGFMRILTEDFVKHYENKLLNIHPSLLPKYTGTNTHQRAIDAGDKLHGISVHYVVPELDAGPVILQGQIDILEGDTPDSLQQRIHKIEHVLYPLAVKWFAENRLNIVDNQVLLDGERSIKQLQSFSN